MDCDSIVRRSISARVSACCSLIAPSPRSRLSSLDFFAASSSLVSERTAYFWSFVSRNSAIWASVSDMRFLLSDIDFSASSSAFIAEFSLSWASKREFSISAIAAVFFSISEFFSENAALAEELWAFMEAISRFISEDKFFRFSISASADSNCDWICMARSLRVVRASLSTSISSFMRLISLFRSMKLL